MIRVQLTSSSEVYRAGMEQMLLSDPGIRVVPEAPEGRSEIRVADDEPPDVVIAEIEEASEDSGWTELLDLNGPDTALLLLVDDPSAYPVSDALRSGVRGILPRRISRDELVAAVRAVAAGLVALHPDSTSVAFPGRIPQPGRPNALIEPLTPREKEVMTVMAEGGSNKEIASRLSISEHTVKFHVASIMSKLGATSRTEAVTLAIRQGLIMV